MPYHEIKTKGKKTYNYLVRTVRKGGTWQKKRKYIGKGKLPENQIEKELKKYEKELEESRYFEEGRQKRDRELQRMVLYGAYLQFYGYRRVFAEQERNVNDYQ